MFSPEQLSYAGQIAMDFEMRQKPEDLYNTDRPLLRKLNETKKPFPGAKQYIVEKLRTSNDANFQWFGPDDQVTFNRKRTIDDASFSWGSAHDGFALTEEELLANYITVTDNRDSAPTTDEKKQFINLIRENTETLTLGFKEKLDLDLHRDGTQNADSIPGLDALVSTTPTVGTVAGIDRSVAGNAFWRNQVNLDIAKADLITKMEQTWRACMRVGGNQPNYILAGSTFIDIYKEIADSTINRELMITGNGKAGPMDIAVNAVNYKGVPIIWDPVFYDLDAADSPGQEWESRCYFLNTRYLKLRPAEGQDMVVRRPPRAYDRYTHYWGLTWRGAITTTNPGAMAVLSVTGS